MSTIDISRMCCRAKYLEGVVTPFYTPYGYTPELVNPTPFLTGYLTELGNALPIGKLCPGLLKSLLAPSK